MAIYHHMESNDLLDALKLAAFDLSTDRTKRLAAVTGSRHDIICADDINKMI
jgi:hypothetical protein